MKRSGKTAGDDFADNRVPGKGQKRARKSLTDGTELDNQGALIRTHRDGLPRFSARSVRCGDAGHREARATLPESLSAGPPTPKLSADPPIGKPPRGSRMRSVGGRRNGLTMHRIAGAAPPTRRTAYAISIGPY